MTLECQNPFMGVTLSFEIILNVIFSLFTKEEWVTKFTNIIKTLMLFNVLHFWS